MYTCNFAVQLKNTQVRILYSTAMQLALGLFPLAKGLKGKAGLLVRAQLSFDDTLAQLRLWREGQGKVIWFHCASLGEFEQGRPVLEGFKQLYPEYSVLLTFFSPSGYEVRKNYALADFICYLPWDTPARAHAFVAAARAEKVVIVKYEFWPNLIAAIRETKAQLIGISVILRPSQAFFKPWGGYMREALTSFDHLFVQNSETASLLDSIAYTSYTLAGDTRFDRVINTAAAAEDVPGMADFVGQSPVMVAGSVWQEDMEVLKPFILQHPEMKFIIAPHDIKPEQIEGWRKDTGGMLFSEGKGNAQVLYINNVGLLSKLYKYAHFAFVGGAYRTGLHNILEPVVFGVPVFFGNKKYKKFREALDLLNLGVARAVGQDLEADFAAVDPEKVKILAAEYVSSNAGATEKILEFIKPLR